MGTAHDGPPATHGRRAASGEGTSRRRRPRRRRRPGVLVVLGLFVLTLLGVGVWAAVDVRTGYRHLRAAEAAASQARTALLDGDIATADTAFATANEAFVAAGAHLSGTGVRLVASLPVARQNLGAVDTLTDAGSLVTTAGQDVTSAILELPGGAAALAPREGRLPVQHIAALAPALDEAAALVEEADRRVAEAPRRLLVARVAAARQAFAAQLTTVREPVLAGRALAGMLPAYLGQDGPRRYFFGAQNPAEARGTGGLIGAWTILTVEGGQLRFGDFETISALTLPSDEAFAVAPPDEEYGRRYGQFAAAGHGSNINMTPDFPTAAEALLNLHELRRGEALDGVILADPFVFEAMLRLVGAVDVPEVGSLDAGSVVQFLTTEQWAEFPEDGTRKPVLGEVAQTTLQRFLGNGGDAARSLQVLGQTAGAGHLLLHSTQPEEQRAFVAAGVAGAFPPGAATVGEDVPGSVFALVINNAAANKLDAYLERAIDYDVWLDASGDAFLRATVELENTAPTSGASTTVLGPNIDGLGPGDHRMYLSVYCGRDCDLVSHSRDGEPAMTGSAQEAGLGVHSQTIDLPSAQRTQLVYEWRQRDAWDGSTYEVLVPGQSLVRATDTEIRVHSPLDGRLRPVGSAAVARSDGVVAWSGRLGRRAALTVELVGS